MLERSRHDEKRVDSLSEATGGGLGEGTAAVDTGYVTTHEPTTSNGRGPTSNNGAQSASAVHMSIDSPGWGCWLGCVTGADGFRILTCPSGPGAGTTPHSLQHASHSPAAQSHRRSLQPQRCRRKGGLSVSKGPLREISKGVTRCLQAPVLEDFGPRQTSIGGSAQQRATGRCA